jgi:hypothetical protein
VLEVQPKAELYERMLCHLGLKVTDCDIVTMQMYHMMQEKKEWHAARKVSIGFALRAKVVAERKIVYNQENLAATHARREDTNQTQSYTKLVNKVMPNIPLTGFAAYKSQARSQATIAEEFRKGFKGVSFCQNCNIYSRDNVMKPHKCKKKSGSAAGGKSQAKLYEKWKLDADSVKECLTCGMYYLKAHKKCAAAKSKAKLSAADKRLIDEMQDRDGGGTQPQGESLGLSQTKLATSKRSRTGKKQSEKLAEDEEVDDEDEYEEEMEVEEEDSCSDSSASYTPRNLVRVSTPTKKGKVGVNKEASTHHKSSESGQEKFARKGEIELLERAVLEERARKARAAEWEANLPPRVDHPDARGEDLYDEADLDALRFEKEIGRRDPFTTETESQRLSRDPMIAEDWDSITGNNCWVRSGVVDRVVSHINSTYHNKEILVSNVALEHALFPDISDAKKLQLFLAKNDPAEKAALWKQVRI